MSKVKTVTIDLVFLRKALVPRIYLDSACCCYWYFSFSVLCFVEELPHLLWCLSVFWCTQEVGGKHETKSSVSPSTFVPWPLPACFTTEQSADKASLFVSYKTTSSIEICWCVLDMYRISSKLRLQTSVWTIVAANKRKRNEITRIRIEGWKPICSLQWKWSSSMQ